MEKVVESGWGFRAVAQRLDDGSVALVSPIAGTVAASASALGALGQPSFVLAPNHFHHLGLAETRLRYPEARVVASPVAARRLTAQFDGVVEGLDGLRARLPEGVTLLQPPGVKTGEVWLRVQTSQGVTWVVSDAFFNVTFPLRGTMGVLLRATGTAPGLRIGSTFLWLGLSDRRAYRGWLEAQLKADAPTTLVPGHGDVLHDDALPERLQELVARRL